MSLLAAMAEPDAIAIAKISTADNLIPCFLSLEITFMLSPVLMFEARDAPILWHSRTFGLSTRLRFLKGVQRGAVRLLEISISCVEYLSGVMKWQVCPPVLPALGAGQRAPHCRSVGTSAPKSTIRTAIGSSAIGHSGSVQHSALLIERFNAFTSFVAVSTQEFVLSGYRKTQVKEDTSSTFFWVYTREHLGRPRAVG
jgi:hypothetical protein